MEYPNASVSRLNKEHGVINAEWPDNLPQIGEHIRIVPNHAIVVIKLFNEIYLLNEDILTIGIDARNMMQQETVYQKDS